MSRQNGKGKVILETDLPPERSQSGVLPFDREEASKLYETSEKERIRLHEENRDLSSKYDDSLKRLEALESNRQRGKIEEIKSPEMIIEEVEREFGLYEVLDCDYMARHNGPRRPCAGTIEEEGYFFNSRKPCKKERAQIVVKKHYNGGGGFVLDVFGKENLAMCREIADFISNENYNVRVILCSHDVYWACPEGHFYHSNKS